jgi:hypothetical protein
MSKLYRKNIVILGYADIDFLGYMGFSSTVHVLYIRDSGPRSIWSAIHVSLSNIDSYSSLLL